jgi:hypothetical protein
VYIEIHVLIVVCRQVLSDIRFVNMSSIFVVACQYCFQSLFRTSQENCQEALGSAEQQQTVIMRVLTFFTAVKFKSSSGLWRRVVLLQDANFSDIHGAVQQCTASQPRRLYLKRNYIRMDPVNKPVCEKSQHYSSLWLICLAAILPLVICFPMHATDNTFLTLTWSGSPSVNVE